MRDAGRALVGSARIPRRGNALWKARAVVIACFATTSLTARADPPPVDQAADLFRQGREAMKGGNYGGACALFEASQRVEPAPGTLLNLAVCSEKLGRLRRAAQALEAFLAATEAADERRPRAAALLADVLARTPRVSVRVPDSAPVGVRVLVDGERIAPETWKAAMALDPGPHVLEVRAPGGPDQRRTLELRERDRLVETFAFPKAEEPERAPRPLPPRSDELPAAFYISLGVGIGGLVTAAGSGAVVLRQRATVEEHCKNKQCDVEGIAAGEQGRRFETIGAIALPVGVAGMALAGYLWLTTKRQDPSTTIGVALSPSQAIVSAGGSY
jgi:hypothetical protein